MNTFNTLQNNTQQFTVSKKQVSKSKILKTSILYNKIESSVNSSINLYKDANFTFKSIDFDIIKNAYLNDKLIIKNNIKKMSDTEIVLKITVSKKEEKEQNIICKAVFGYSVQKTS